MGLNFNGDHIYQFQAIQTLKSIVKKRHDEREQLSMELKVLESRWQRFKDFIQCKSRAQRLKDITEIRKKLDEMENPAMLFAELGVSGNFVKSAERKWKQKNQAR